MKTVIDLRDDLWEKGKILAAKQRKDLKTIVNEALEAYLREQVRVKKEGEKK